eukprot:gene17460-23762_t
MDFIASVDQVLFACKKFYCGLFIFVMTPPPEVAVPPLSIALDFSTMGYVRRSPPGVMPADLTPDRPRTVASRLRRDIMDPISHLLAELGTRRTGPPPAPPPGPCVAGPAASGPATMRWYLDEDRRVVHEPPSTAPAGVYGHK